MNDHDSLLAAILAHPDEDTPRLMFADWLQENGQSARAEFIRAQVRGVPDDWIYNQPSQHPLTPHQQGHRSAFPGWRLLGWNPADRDVRYQRPYEQGLSHSVFKVMFARGFADRVTLSAVDWLTHAEAVLARHPLRQVKLTTMPRTRTTGRSDPFTGEFLWLADLGGNHRGGLILHEDYPDRRSAVVARLQAEWPGVTFEIPRGERFDDLNDLLRQLREVPRIPDDIVDARS